MEHTVALQNSYRAGRGYGISRPVSAFWLPDGPTTRLLTELGVVFLMFTIGLDLPILSRSTQGRHDEALIAAGATVFPKDEGLESGLVFVGQMLIMLDIAPSQVEARLNEIRAQDYAKITAEAVTAVNETKKALKLLDEENSQGPWPRWRATGKLELILARDPKLALAPVDVEVVTYDLLANLDTVKALIHDAENYLEDGEVQKARPLVATHT